ncbi:MAG: class I SAM-dependent methyltransferase [Chthoniobacteraceae bacterium]
MTSAPLPVSDFFAAESDPAVAALRTKMDAFYAATADYAAFQTTSHYRDEWGYVREAISARLKNQPTCRVLEFGAGRTGFAQFSGDLRRAIHFTAHDVTPANADFLRTQADEVRIGSISAIEGPFEVIFSTFVLEHVSDPRQTLDTLFDLLQPGGVMLLFCPRYDVPFYLSHSADHYSRGQRIRLGFDLIFRRLRTLLTGRPEFLIHVDPSLFYLPWSIDRDAIHWVSLFDLRAFFAGRGDLRNLPVSSGSAKDWFVKNFLRVNLAITKQIGTDS